VTEKDMSKKFGAIKDCICDDNLTRCASFPGWHYLMGQGELS